ncbi:hypothetical protein PUN28_013200 [Cardiocondyla obscurior]|uniref:Uncharacterized protein n=1 Tax=Cardiocondyla obscurior TaxID=286306 RepID=A0AAW2F8Q4_9HYME
MNSDLFNRCQTDCIVISFHISRCSSSPLFFPLFFFFFFQRESANNRTIFSPISNIFILFRGISFARNDINSSAFVNETEYPILPDNYNCVVRRC